MTLVPAAPAMTPALVDDLDTAARLIAAARSPRTVAEYRRDWKRFAAWAQDRGLDPVAVQPEHVAAYVGSLVDEGYKASTINRAVYAVAVTLDDMGRGDDNPVRHPGVKRTLKGMRNTVGVAPKRARPLSTTELGRISSHLPDTLIGKRDRALLLLGFAAALRRSEISALDTADLTDSLSGLEVNIRRSKADQQGAGAVIPVATSADPVCCPVLAWRAWRTAAQLDDGPAFRSIDRHGRMGGRLSARAVTTVLERSAQRAGVSTDRLSAHSLRAGYVTAAAQRGHREMDIKEISRHASLTVLQGYVRRATVWNNPATDLGW